MLENAKHEIAEPIEEKSSDSYRSSSENESDSFPDSAVVYQFIGNSIKYSKPDVAPEIKIDYEKASFEKSRKCNFHC